MSYQPVSGDPWVNIGTLGTTAYAGASVLHNVLVSGTFVGSVEFYDSATAAGTAASNFIFSVGLPATSLYRAVPINARLRNGLTVVATGTPSLTFTYE